jgi:hypothetical protein
MAAYPKSAYKNNPGVEIRAFGAHAGPLRPPDHLRRMAPIPRPEAGVDSDPSPCPGGRSSVLAVSAGRVFRPGKMRIVATRRNLLPRPGQMFYIRSQT